MVRVVHVRGEAVSVVVHATVQVWVGRQHTGLQHVAQDVYGQISRTSIGLNLTKSKFTRNFPSQTKAQGAEFGSGVNVGNFGPYLYLISICIY